MPARSSHTGGDSGDDAAFDRELAEVGVVRVRSLDALVATAAAFVHVGPLSGRRMAIMSGSGGACGILADRATDEGFDLPAFSPSTQAQLEEALPGQPTVQNPLDITGRVVLDPSRRDLALGLLLAQQPPFDVVVIQTPLPPVAPKQPEPVLDGYRALGKLAGSSPTPVVVLGGVEGSWRGWAEEELAAQGLPCLGGMDLGMEALGHLAWYQEAIS